MSKSQTVVASKAVPILTYHSLDDSGAVTSVAPRDFREQMRILAERGFTGISLSMLLDSWESGAQLPSHPVVLTFDDGYANVLEHAAPLLNDLGFRATLFVITGRCGQSNDWPDQLSGTPRLPLLSWSALAEMAGIGFEIGAHGVTHRPLIRISRAEATREIEESKSAIEDQFGRPVQTFAYPYGLSDRATRQVVRQHFRAACGTRLDKAKPTHDRYQLPRLDVYYFRSPAVFRTFETPIGRAYLHLRAAGRELRKKIFDLRPSAALE